MNKNTNVRYMTLVGFGVALNIVGAFIAFTLKLPIYMDSIGTILVACSLGPRYAVIAGIAGSVISGITFDIYSLYFAPVQVSTGLIAGIMYNKGFLKGLKAPFGILAFTIPTSIISAFISSFLFGGVTSSGSSYIVQILTAMEVPNVISVFATQVCTDYADKFIAVVLVAMVVKSLPKNIKSELEISK